MWIHSDDWIRKIPRITIVRNPYSRLLSCFIEKMLLRDVPTSIEAKRVRRRIKPEGYSVRGSFANFVHAALNATKLEHSLSLQTYHCSIQHSLYHYALHLEEFGVWHKPALRMLGVTNMPSFLSRNFEDGHFAPRNYQGADEKLTDYYTQEIAEAVTLWASPDMATFKYPAWNHRASLCPSTPGTKPLCKPYRLCFKAYMNFPRRETSILRQKCIAGMQNPGTI
mmetsp:Transcript_29793/g.62705  ORF Transcript_29793/g.62705 Transcript_29793/m.62705 type:complete len:224 (-) Transcript_29793:2-673(-)